jgi:gliding motility-associated-like protein
MKNFYSLQSYHARNTTKGCIQRELKLWTTTVLLMGIAMFLSHRAVAQSGLCDPTVPFFTVDLTASPSATWTSPDVVRVDNCCGTTNPDRCIEFEITLHPDAIAINFEIASGAVPPGALFYQINCGPIIPVGEPVCISGVGPHTLTFCKPGNNANTYAVTSIPEPSVSPPQIATPSCSANIFVSGLDSTTIVWQDITGGGLYLPFLSCTTCASPTVTPFGTFPPFVDYLVCGLPLGNCSTELEFCDTVRVYFYSDLTATINPNPAIICEDEGGILLTANFSGGLPPYTYQWYDQPDGTGNLIGTGMTYYATSSGTYSFVVYDSLYPACGPGIANATVIINPNPVITITPPAAGICEGNSLTLQANGGSDYYWNTGETSPSINVTPTTSTTYSVTGTDINGCTGSAEISVEVYESPDVDAGPGGQICLGESFQLNGSGADFYEWTPAATLSDPNIANPVATPSVTTTYYLTGYSIGGNIMFNGDFSLGNTGFTTDYLYNNNLIPEGNYNVSPNPNLHHPNFSPCGDHTTGTGNMMIVNGSPIANQRIWCQTVAVSPGVSYMFSTWLTSVHPDNPAVLQFSINGTLLGTPFTASNTVCNWQQFYELWDSGINTSAEICIVNQNTIHNGNDFAIDDIYFAPLCPAIDSVTVIVNPNPVIVINPTSPEICLGESADLTATADVPGTTFQWSTGETNPTITVSPNTTTTYTVTGTTPDGCTGTAQVTVVVHPNPVISINSSALEICDQASATLTGSSDIAGTSWLWSTGQTVNPIIVAPSVTTTYTLTGTSPEGCTGFAQIQIVVHPLPNITANTSAPEICDGESATITAGSDVPGTTWLWNTGQTINPISVSPNSTTTYTVTGTTPDGCTGTAQVTVVVHPTPVISINSSALEICDQASATLTGSSNIPGTSWLWSTGQTTNPIIVAPSVTTTYTLTGTSPDGCTGSAQIQIVVNPLPNITANTSAPEICDGESATITAGSDVPGTTYLWSNGQTTVSIIVVPITTTTYTVTGTTPDGCTGTAQVTVVVHPNPVISINSSAMEICDQASATLTGSSDIPGTSWLWSTGQTVNPITVAPNTTTTYILTGTSPEGCTGFAQIQIVVNPLPNITANTSTPEICNGESATITAGSDVAGTIWLWNTGQTINPISVSPNSTTTYTVTGTTPDGCTGTAQVTVVVHPNPVISVNSSAMEICDQASATLTGSSNIPGTSWLWSTGQTVNPIIVAPSVTTTYTLTGTSPEGCTGFAQIQIVVHPLPNITANTSAPEICNGQSVAITAGSDVPGTTWLWNTGQTINPFSVSPNSTTTYTVTGTTPNGCTGTAQVTVVVHPNPVISINSSALEICNGASATLNASGNLPVSNWNWNTGETGSPITVSPGTSSTYTVTGTTSNGCSGSASIQITVNPLPDVSLSVDDGNICLGKYTTLHASSNGPGATFLWSNGSTTSSTVVQPYTTTTYSVTITNSYGCTSSGEIVVEVLPNPVITVTPADPEICLGMSVTLTANSTHPNTDYIWSNAMTTPSITVSPQSTTTYTVTGTDEYGCSGSSRVIVTVLPLPNIQITPMNITICQGEQITLTGHTNMPGTSYLWNTGSQGTSITVTPATSTSYSVTGTAPNGCSNSAMAFVNLQAPPDIQVTPNHPEICIGNSVTMSVSGGIQYTWTPIVPYDNPSGSQVTVTPSSSTQYTITGIDDFGCTGQTTAIVTVHPLPVPDFTSDLHHICEASIVYFESTSTPANEIQTYLWNFGDPTSGSGNTSGNINPSHVFLHEGTYWVSLEVTSVYGCKASIMKPDFITVWPNPIASFTRTPDITDITDAKIYFYNQALGELTFFYDFGDPVSGSENFSTEEHPIHTYTEVGEYWTWQYVTNQYGCRDSTSQRVLVNPAWNIYIPNAFSPNGDGSNDYFIPGGYNIDIDEFSMYIYTRWGEEIFETHDLYRGWDGTVKGKETVAKPDVYVYLVIIRDVFGHEHQFVGNVTVVR